MRRKQPFKKWHVDGCNDCEEMRVVMYGSDSYSVVELVKRRTRYRKRGECGLDKRKP
jgi:hypothetical protein